MIRFIRRAEPRLARVAELTRATRVYCEHIGVTPPSYEQVRRLTHAVRERRACREAAVDLVLDVHLRSRPPADLLHLLADPREAPVRGRRQGK